MEDVVASSQHGTLDRVSTKCSEDPFLYLTVKMYCCRKCIIFCNRLGAEARSFGRWIGAVGGQYGQLPLISRGATGQIC